MHPNPGVICILTGKDWTGIPHTMEWLQLQLQIHSWTCSCPIAWEIPVQSIPVNIWLSRPLVHSILGNILMNLANFLGHHNSILLKDISFSRGNTIREPIHNYQIQNQSPPLLLWLNCSWKLSSFCGIIFGFAKGVNCTFFCIFS